MTDGLFDADHARAVHLLSRLAPPGGAAAALAPLLLAAAAPEKLQVCVCVCVRWDGVGGSLSPHLPVGILCPWQCRTILLLLSPSLPPAGFLHRREGRAGRMRRGGGGATGSRRRGGSRGGDLNSHGGAALSFSLALSFLPASPAALSRWVAPGAPRLSPRSPPRMAAGAAEAGHGGHDAGAVAQLGSGGPVRGGELEES